MGCETSKTPATTQLVKKNHEVALSCLLTRGGQPRKSGRDVITTLFVDMGAQKGFFDTRYSNHL